MFCLIGWSSSHILVARSASPVQKIITTEKGVAIDFDSVSRDSKTQSKELYTWGQGEAQDLKDGACFPIIRPDTVLILAIQLPTDWHT